MVKGAATVDATRGHADRYRARGYASDAYRRLGRTGLTVSAVGFGTARATVDEEEHCAAFREALSLGCNLVDTAPHFVDGDAERLVGRVMSEYDGFDRRGLVVVSKVGTFRGQDLAWLRCQPDADAMRMQQERYAWRSFCPEHIEAQVHRSLERLELERLDCVLLENPEFVYEASMMARPDAPDAVHREHLAAVVADAFTQLEAMVEAGLVGWYGVCSDCLTGTVEDELTVPIPMLVDCAVAAGGDNHHFAVIQCPVNVLETTAVADGETPSPVAVAQSLDLGVLTCRPLNAIVGGRLIRLADFDTGVTMRVDRLVRAARSLEDEFAEGLGRAFEVEGVEDDTRLFDNAERLQAVARSLKDVVLWSDYVEDSIDRDLASLVGQIDAGLTGPLKAAWTFWIERYVEAISALVEGLTWMCARASQRRSDRIARHLRRLVPQDGPQRSLSQLSLTVVRDLEGIHSVLVGMRRVEHAVDALETMAWEQTDQTANALERVARRVIDSQ